MSHSYDDVQAVLPTAWAKNDNFNTKDKQTAIYLSLNIAFWLESFGKIVKIEMINY